MARSSTTFKAGNQAAKTHGARAKVTGADTGAIRAQTLEEFPSLATQPELHERLVSARTHVQELRAYLERVGLLDGRGHPRKALELLRAREKDIADTVKLIQAGIPALDAETPWRLAQARLRVKYGSALDPGLYAREVALLAASGQPPPEPIKGA